MHHVLSSLLFVSLAASPLAAQVIEPPVGAPVEAAFTGVVQPAFAPTPGELELSICAPPSHTLECSAGTFFVSSSTLDLDAYIGQNVKLYGTQLFECPTFDIHTVESPPPATLAICGTGVSGCPVRLRSGPGGLATHWVFASLASGFFPLSPVKGSFMLSPPFFQVAMGFSNSFGPGPAFDFTVPPAPFLTGLTIYFQAARREVGITTPSGLTQPPVQFSNVVCLPVLGFSGLLCVPADC